MRTEIVCTYKNLATEIDDLIDIADYSSSDIASKIGLSLASFVMKKKRNSFSANEVEKIMHWLGEEKVESYMMIKIMDAKTNEPTVSLTEFKTRMGWK